MLKRLAITTLAGGVLAVAGATAAFATPTLAPQASRTRTEALSSAPNGFGTVGFAHAKTVYAGSGQSAHSNNPKAVSQYDVACFQLSPP